MADSSPPEHSGSSADDSAASPPAEWCAEQWSVLCDVLDVSDPTEVVPQVRALADDAAGSTPDPTRVKEPFGEMRDHAGTVQTSAEVADILGLESTDEARELEQIVRRMSTSLEALHTEREELMDELGVADTEDVLDLVRSLEHQLSGFYELTDQASGEQLDILYTDRAQLHELGLSSVESAVKMIESMSAQLEALYSDCKDEPRPDALAGAPEASSLNGSPSPPAPEAENRSARLEPVFSSMRDQLEALYEEKEALLNLGLDDARQAAQRIDELKARLSTLQHEHQQCRGRLEQLQDALGTTNVDKIVDMVEAVPDVFGESKSPSPSEADRNITSIDDGPALLPDDLQDPLDALSEPELDDLSVGVLRLDDDGTIKYLNEAALALPGLDTAGARSEWLGEFLFQVVPSTSNTLFLNRFRGGVENESMDARFPYTFVSSQHPPTAFFVHLYREGPDGSNWLLLRPAE